MLFFANYGLITKNAIIYIIRFIYFLFYHVIYIIVTYCDNTGRRQIFTPSPQLIYAILRFFTLISKMFGFLVTD